MNIAILHLLGQQLDRSFRAGNDEVEVNVFRFDGSVVQDPDVGRGLNQHGPPGLDLRVRLEDQRLYQRWQGIFRSRQEQLTMLPESCRIQA